jgi:Spy/CpxP family protein refolding chaperone
LVRTSKKYIPVWPKLLTRPERFYKYRTRPEVDPLKDGKYLQHMEEQKMRIQSKVVLALVTFAVSLPLAFGQDTAPAPVPPPIAMRQQQFRRGPIHLQQMDQRGRRGFQRGHWGHRNGGMHRQFMLANLVKNPSFRERIGITSDQAQKIETQTFNFRKAMIDNRATLEVKRLELGQLLSAATPDRSAIDQKLQEISAARLSQAKTMIDFRLDMRTALTPEQRQKMQQMRQDFRHRGFGPQGPDAAAPDVNAPATAG